VKATPAVAVADEHVAALRAFIVGDHDEHRRLIAELRDGDMPGYQLLALGALAAAARHEFPPERSLQDVIRFVALVRVHLAPTDGDDLDPLAAEAVLRFALGQDVPWPLDSKNRLRAIIFLLGALTQGHYRGTTRLDDLLVEAQSLADRWHREAKDAHRPGH
jgi:hypothetical protein